MDKIMSSKKRIEDRILDLEEELADLQEVLRIVNEYLNSKPRDEDELGSEIPAKTVRPEGSIPEVFEQIIPLKASDGTMLASYYLGKTELKVVPVESLTFRVNVPPFQQFLINKVLANMTVKDREDAVAGIISPEEMLTYRVHQDGDVLKELVIRNFRDSKRAETLRNSVRWTLEKMYDKSKL